MGNFPRKAFKNLNGEFPQKSFYILDFPFYLMTAVRLTEAGNAYLRKAPPWSKKMFAMGRLGFPPGTVPPHLMPYLLKSGEVRQCVQKAESAGLTGSAKVISINTCIAMMKSKGRRE